MQFIQLATISVIFLIAFIGFNNFGQRSTQIFANPEDKERFDQIVSGRLGSSATITAIFGTLTSLATVYIFF